MLIDVFLCYLCLQSPHSGTESSSNRAHHRSNRTRHHHHNNNKQQQQQQYSSIEDDENGHLIYAVDDVLQDRCKFGTLVCCLLLILTLFPFADQIKATLGEGTFGKVVSVLDLKK